MIAAIFRFLLIACLLLVGACSGDPTTSDEYQALDQELADAREQLADVVANAEAVAVVEANEAAYMETFHAHDLDAFMDTFADDAVVVGGFGDHFEGKAAIRSMYASVITFSDPDQSEVLDLYVSGGGTTATSTWEWIGTNSFGNPFHLPTVLIHEYQDGKIARETIYYASRNSYDELMGS